MDLYRLIRPLLFRLEAERAHTLVTGTWNVLMRFPGARAFTSSLRYDHPALHVSVSGMSFANPIGLAGGFDKDGRFIHAMAHLGFGFIELGTVTPRPQAGNPAPRLFRLIEDQALINRLGFNNHGVESLARRVQLARRRLPIGINIGKNRDTPSEKAAADYLACYQKLARLADYIVVNVSSPNTPGLRDLQRAEALRELLAVLMREREILTTTTPSRTVPIFVKLSPDETPQNLDAALDVVLTQGAEGIIATNTTIDRPAGLRSRYRFEQGGLSGKPLDERSTAVIRYLYRALGQRLPIIGVGGIDGPESAYGKILAGASLLQIYTALIYQGPGVIADILRGLVRQLHRDGFSTIGQAVGQAASVAAEG